MSKLNINNIKLETNAEDIPITILELSVIKLKDNERVAEQDVSDLKDRIATVGLLNPITLNGKYEILAGRRRFKAVQELGRKTIATRIFAGLSLAEESIITLVENIARENYAWHEEVRVFGEIHKLLIAKDEKWGYRDSATKLGVSVGKAHSYINFAEVLITFPDLCKQISLNRAKTEYSKLTQQVESHMIMKSLSPKEQEILDLMARGQMNKPVKSNNDLEKIILNDGTSVHDDIIPEFCEPPVRSKMNNLKSIEAKDGTNTNNLGYSYIIGDNTKYIEAIPDNTVGLVELDPPYAIEFDKNFGKTSKLRIDERAIDWSTEQLYTWYKEQLPILYNKMQSNTWMLIWTGRDHIVPINKIAEQSGFATQQPGIWPKPGGAANSPYVRMVSNYEMFLLMRKGKAKFRKPSMNACIPIMPPAAAKGRIHQWEKPIPLYDYLFAAIGGVRNSIFLSPFAGSGNAMISAYKIGMIPYGCDIEESYLLSFVKRFSGVKKLCDS